MTSRRAATFVQSRLINIALSYIPETSLLFKCIKTAQECYASQVPFREARTRIHNCAPGTFGIQSVKMSDMPEDPDGLEAGKPGMDCPENIAYSIAGWLYGGDDFGKCITLANACGEDTDCTAAMLGAVMGIILGERKIPDKWKAPLNDRIATMCIDRTSGGIWVPETATELTERIMRVMPSFLGVDYADIFDPAGLSVFCREGDELAAPDSDAFMPLIKGDGKTDELPLHKLCTLSPWVVRKAFPAMTVLVDYGDSAFFRRDSARKIRVTVLDAGAMKEQQWVKIQIWLPAGVSAVSGDEYELPLNNLYSSRAETEFVLDTSEFSGGRLEAVISVSLTGRHSFGAVPVTLFRGPSGE